MEDLKSLLGVADILRMSGWFRKIFLKDKSSISSKHDVFSPQVKVARQETPRNLNSDNMSRQVTPKRVAASEEGSEVNRLWQPQVREGFLEINNELTQLLPTSFAAAQQKLPWPQEWYFQKLGQSIGPFTYPEMLKHLQSGQLKLNSLVWRQGLPRWQSALTTTEFQPKTIKRLHEFKVIGLQDRFKSRKYRRVPFAAQLVLHNQKQIWKAISFEIGAGGLGVLADTADLQPGAELFLHTISISSGPAVNAVVRIVNKSVHGLRPGQARYGLEFVDVHSQVQTEIREFAESEV